VAIAEIKASNPTESSSYSYLPLDITDESSIDSASRMVAAEFKRIDVLINNAGIHPTSGKLCDLMRHALSTNTVSQAAVTEAFRPLLKQSPNPRLIFISSSVGSITLRCDPTNKTYNGSAIPYRCSKAALNMLTACYAKELKDEFGCKVWAVDPGLVATNLTGNPEALRARGAEDPSVSARMILAVCEGKRDGDVGKLINKDGVLPW